MSRQNFAGMEHEILEFWEREKCFRRLREKNAGKPEWSFLDGPITANNPMGVHHAWGRTYKDIFHRYPAMTGHELLHHLEFPQEMPPARLHVSRLERHALVPSMRNRHLPAGNIQ